VHTPTRTPTHHTTSSGGGSSSGEFGFEGG
jgi:hypothetical protein